MVTAQKVAQQLLVGYMNDDDNDEPSHDYPGKYSGSSHAIGLSKGSNIVYVLCAILEEYTGAGKKKYLSEKRHNFVIF